VIAGALEWFMRRQRLSIFDRVSPWRSLAGDWRGACARVMPPLALSACVLAGAVAVLYPTPAPAEDDKLIEGGKVYNSDALPEPGMPASNPRVRSILAAHPDELVTVCVAGCNKPTIVQMLPKPRERRIAGMRTTAAGGEASLPSYDRIDRDAVMCVAGCAGRAGQVVQRLPNLPPVKVAPQKTAKDNEPLDRW